MSDLIEERLKPIMERLSDIQCNYEEVMDIVALNEACDLTAADASNIISELENLIGSANEIKPLLVQFEYATEDLE